MFSIEFIVFLIVAFVGYYIIPPKHRYIWLLTAGYCFYAVQSKLYTLILVLVTLITYCASVAVSKHKKSLYLVIGTLLPAFVLLFFKLCSFLSARDGNFLGGLTTETFGISKIIMPLGISFYTLAAIGYVVDVYKGQTEAEKNILRYGLFVSFFPTIISGPIERSGNLLKQLREEKLFSYELVRKGFLRILWGYFMKLLVANRLAVIVDAAFNSYSEQTGATMMIALILYGVQIYVDFAAYSIIVLGIGNLFGFSILENFKQPYFAISIKDFWRRWHISLSNWLRDYIYIPLGGNRKGTLRKYINLIVTFLISGLWHGNGIKYIIWGLIHGMYQVLGSLLKPSKDKALNVSKIKTNCFSFKLLEAIVTFLLVDFAWLFFRAPSTGSALSIIKQILTEFSLGRTINDKLFLCGYDIDRFYLVLVYIIIILVIDVFKEKKTDIFEWLYAQNKVFRWLIYIVLCIIVLTGIIYDFGVEASTFIYTQF